MSDVLIIYASISGRTRRIVVELSKKFSPLSVDSINLREGINHSLLGYKLLVFGSPTYGIGEWHHLWDKWSARIESFDIEWPQQPVAFFALGDAKHHPESFARAILHLGDFVHRLGARLVGQVPFDVSYDAHLCIPLLTGSQFPGLVLDHVTQRKLTEKRIESWVCQIRSEIGGIQVPHDSH
ncbi:MAG: flavodoxin domain-containing protein [Pirellulales bacterium]